MSRQYNKTGRQPPQYQDVWTDKTYFITEEVFPTVLRRSEVIEIRVEDISPLESALQDLEQKSKELAALSIRYTQYYETDTVNAPTNTLASALNNAVDAPAGSGVKVYRDTFLTPDFISRNPDQLAQIQKLRELIDDYVIMDLFQSFPID